MQEIKILLIGVVFGFLTFGCCSNVNTNINVPLEGNKLVVKLQIEASVKDVTVIASGFAVDNNHVVTAGHFCSETMDGSLAGVPIDNISLGYIGVNEKIYFIDGLVIKKIDKRTDLCLLEKKGGHGITPVILNDSYEYQIGRYVYAVGAPLGWFPVETFGKIIGGGEHGHEFASSVSAAYGNSGCPVFDENNHVVGMIVKVAQRYNHISISVKASAIKKFLQDG